MSDAKIAAAPSCTAVKDLHWQPPSIEDPSTTAYLDISSQSISGDDDGDDDLYIIRPMGRQTWQEKNLNRRTWMENNRQVSFTQSDEPKRLDTWSACAILVNFISMGYILNPSAFAQGGTLLATICMALVSLQSMITGVYVLEACTRAEMLKVSMYAASFHEHRSRALEPGALEQEEGDDSDMIVLKQKRSSSKGGRRYLPRAHSLRVHQRTFELSELCRIFMGRWLRNLFTVTSAGDLYGITWTLAVVFGSSLSEHIPIGTDWDYQIYVLIFMAITVPVSCMRITVQVPLQILFLLARTLMLGLMVGTLIAAYFSSEPHFGIQEEPARETPLANFSSIITVVQLCVFSTAFQFSVPGLTAETGNKSSMVGVIVRSVSYIFATNLILSVLMAIYFGSATQGSANLNWLTYHGGTWDGEGELTRSWWATAISSYIVLWAAIDGIAVYPLICISLGDIMMGATYEDKVHEMQENWKVRISFRLLACIPQAVGSMFLTDLGAIAKIAGVFTVMSYTICPSYLAIKSRKAIEDAKLPTTTKYSTLFSSNWVAWTIILLAASLICGVFYDAFATFGGSIVAEDETAVVAGLEQGQDDLLFN